MRTPYWNPRTETLPREQLDQLRLRKLRDHVAWTLENAPWQGRLLREAGVRAEDISSLDDLRRIPFMTRDDWMESQIADPPFGDGPRAAARGGHALPPDLRARAAAGRSRSSTARRTGSGSRSAGATASGASASAPATACSSPSATARSSGSGAPTTPPRSSAASCCPGGNMTTEARVRQIMATGRDRRLLHADLRAAHGAGGPVARHRPRQRPRPARASSRASPRAPSRRRSSSSRSSGARRRPTPRA